MVFNFRIVHAIPKYFNNDGSCHRHYEKIARSQDRLMASAVKMS